MKNVKEINIEFNAEEWSKYLDRAFEKNKKDIKLDGFRKGAVTKELYIKKAGIEALYSPACDIAIEDAYKKALEEANVAIVCEPKVEIMSISEKGISFKFTLISKPEVKLGKYKDLGIKKEKVTVTKEEIEHQKGHLLEHMAEVVVKENGEIVNGNTAVIDFEGVVDGEKLEGGSGKNYPLEIGSNTFIPGFESGLVGMKTGETKVLKLKFPENYVENLKNKDVEFTVTVNEIKERITPEMDEDFFADLGIEGVTSVETLDEHIKKDIKEHKEKEAEEKYLDNLLRTACENMKVEINPEIIDAEVDRMIEGYNQELAMQGVTFEQYCQFTGTDIETVKASSRGQAEARIKTRYLLDEVAKEEKIEVSKEEVDKEVKAEAEKYQMKEDEFLAAVGGAEVIEFDLKLKKALEIIKEG